MFAFSRHLLRARHRPLRLPRGAHARAGAQAHVCARPPPPLLELWPEGTGSSDQSLHTRTVLPSATRRRPPHRRPADAGVGARPLTRAVRTRAGMGTARAAFAPRVCMCAGVWVCMGMCVRVCVCVGMYGYVCVPWALRGCVCKGCVCVYGIGMGMCVCQWLRMYICSMCVCVRGTGGTHARD